MTREEIKNTYSMRDIVARYGLHPNRAGFISCPFHQGDRTPSMKIYEKDYYCHACGANGDIFTFVQRMEGLSFKEAFLELGGEYEKEPSFASRLAIYRARKARATEQAKQERKARECFLNMLLISVYRKWMDKSEPLSDTWCDCYNRLQYQLYRMAVLNDMEMRW